MLIRRLASNIFLLEDLQTRSGHRRRIAKADSIPRAAPHRTAHAIPGACPSGWAELVLNVFPGVSRRQVRVEARCDDSYVSLILLKMSSAVT